MSKSEEKAMFAAWVESLPKDSYLRPMMAGIQCEVETAIANDFAFVEWSRRVDEMREHAAALSELTAKMAALKTEFRNLDRQADRLREGIAALRGEARRLATI
jgi:hypothetical protein